MFFLMSGNPHGGGYFLRGFLFHLADLGRKNFEVLSGSGFGT